MTEQFGGSELDVVRNRLIRQLRETRESMNSVMLDAIEMAQQAFEVTESEGEFVVAGETNLMGLEGMGGMSKLKRLFEAFARQHDILHLLDKTLNAHGVQIFIGKESGYRLLDEYSVGGRAL